MRAKPKKVELEVFRIKGTKHYCVQIEDYPGYFVSTQGKVISCVSGFRAKSSDPRGSSKPRVLKPRVNNSGYPRVYLKAPIGKPKNELVHRLVAKTYFLPPSPAPDAKEPFFMDPHLRVEVNHIDGNKKNNRVSNLEWNSVQENREHRTFLKSLQEEKPEKVSRKRSTKKAKARKGKK